MNLIADGLRRDASKKLSTNFMTACRLAVLDCTGIDTEEKYEALTTSWWYGSVSKFLSVVFRHGLCLHEDGSLSVPELMTLDFLDRRMRDGRPIVANKTGLGAPITEDDYYDGLPEGIDPKQYHHSAVNGLICLVNTIVFNEKGRFEIGYQKEWKQGEKLKATHWSMVPSFHAESQIEKFISFLPDEPCDMVFLRAISGHSISLDREVSAYVYERQNPAREAFAVHGTVFKALTGIKQKGLIPGGPRQTRNDIHFLKETALKSCGTRDTTDILLIVLPHVLEKYGARQSDNGYILVSKIIPFNEIAAVWDLKRSKWNMKPHKDILDIWRNWKTEEDEMRPITSLMHAQAVYEVRQTECDANSNALKVLAEVDRYMKMITEKNLEDLRLTLLDDYRAKDRPTVENKNLERNKEQDPLERPLREPSVPPDEKKRKRDILGDYTEKFALIREMCRNLSNFQTELPEKKLRRS